MTLSGRPKIGSYKSHPQLRRKKSLEAKTHYKCDHLQCKCIPGRFLCGENGSIDLSDFLDEKTLFVPFNVDSVSKVAGPLII
jgi:hypothetical protein